MSKSNLVWANHKPNHNDLGISNSQDESFLTKIFREYGLPRSGLIHIGAHHIQELELYESMGIQCVLWIEGDEAAILNARKKLESSKPRNHNILVKGFCSNVASESVLFKASNNGASTSILRPLEHRAIFPEIKFQTTECKTVIGDHIMEELDSAWARKCNFKLMVIDVQGAELKVLQGFSSTLNRLNGLIVEIGLSNLYKDQASLEQINKFLATRNFVPISAEFNPSQGFGEVLYLRNKINVPNRFKLFRSRSKGQNFRILMEKVMPN